MLLAVVVTLTFTAVLTKHHRDAMNDFSRLATQSLNIPLSMMLTRSELLSLHAEALFKTALGAPGQAAFVGTLADKVYQSQKPLTQLYQSYGGQGFNESSSVQLESLEFATTSGSYFGIQKVSCYY